MAFKLFGKGKTDVDELSEDLIDLSADEIGAETVASSSSVGGSIVDRLFSIRNLGTGFVAVLMMVGWVLFLNTTQAERDTRYIERSSHLLMLSQRIAKDAREAVQGQESSFKTLKTSRDTFEQTVSALKRGNSSMGIEPSPAQVRPHFWRLIKCGRRQKRKVCAARSTRLSNRKRPCLPYVTTYWQLTS